ncbi:MAG: hypothetical protein KGN01_06130 [Patescibacteria group bacterium]|nr:hypothetical protein [Patescibacteria group bacterium]
MKSNEVQAAHPYHKGLKGQQGGSLPKVANNLVNACMDVVNKNRAAEEQLHQRLPNPVTRLKQ